MNVASYFRRFTGIPVGKVEVSSDWKNNASSSSVCTVESNHSLVIPNSSLRNENGSIDSKDLVPMTKVAHNNDCVQLPPSTLKINGITWTHSRNGTENTYAQLWLVPVDEVIVSTRLVRPPRQVSQSRRHRSGRSQSPLPHSLALAENQTRLPWNNNAALSASVHSHRPIRRARRRPSV